ncbi:MFS transporter [Bacillus massiliigorillae]|uniref:MFS transporter n=1 Tax=Bacillus massiliigorillae TaxID=1243664 RepID=UPI0003AA6328|nr:MFS transporter [Bacillus massiliigorillae]
MRKNKFVVIMLLLNIFIVFLGIGLIVPIMPTFIDEMHLSGSIMGYMMAAFSLTQFIMSPFAGKWIDRFGRKIMIVVGLFIFSLSELIFGLGTDVSVLFLSRILGGVSAAFIMPGVTAFMADITTVEERAKSMGYISAAISLGFIIGPGIGGFVAEFGVRAPFYFAAVIAFIVAVISLIILKEPLTKEQLSERAAISAKSNFFKEILKSFKPMYLIAFVIVFVLAFGLSAYETVFSLFSDHKFGFVPRDIATILTISSIIAVIAQLFIFDKMVNIMGEKKLIQLCLVVGAFCAVVSTVVGHFGVILLNTCIIFLAFDILRPALTTFLSRMAGSDQGFVAGMNSAYTSLGNIIGPTMAGILFDVNINFPYLFSALILVIGLVITLFWRERQFVKTA